MRFTKRVVRNVGNHARKRALRTNRVPVITPAAEPTEVIAQDYVSLPGGPAKPGRWLAMTPRERGLYWLAAILALASLAPVAQARDASYGRVSYDAGGGYVKGIADADWSYLVLNSLILAGDQVWVDERGAIELELGGGTFLRMADATHGTIAEMPPDVSIRAWTGAFYVQRLKVGSPRAVVITPLCQVVIGRLSQVRIDVMDDGSTTVSVWEGSARIKVEGTHDVVVMKGKRSYVDPDAAPTSPVFFDTDILDDLDQWNQERAEAVAHATDAIPAGVLLSDEVVGASDLSEYGEWFQVESDYCWHPYDETFVPYREGFWSYVSDCGYAWVDAHPYAYVTTHYGRWMYAPDGGWFWVYRGPWAPAWAATLRSGSTFLWCPLDPSGYPVTTSTACFSLGGIHFGIASTTCCDADELLMGRCKPFGCTAEIATGFLSNRAEVWRILANPRGPMAISFDVTMRVRDYTPRRFIRGPQPTGVGRRPAQACVAALETHAAHPDSRAVKTPVSSELRPERMRKIRIEPSVAEETVKATPKPVEPEPQEEHPQRSRVMRVDAGAHAPSRAETETPESRPEPRVREIHTEEPAPQVTVQEASPAPSHTADTSAPERMLRGQTPEDAVRPAPSEPARPAPEPERHVATTDASRAIRSDSKPEPRPQSQPSGASSNSAPSPPSVPAPSRVVESNPAPSASQRHSEDASRSVRGGR